jgi:hypothetical protein
MRRDACRIGNAVPYNEAETRFWLIDPVLLKKGYDAQWKHHAAFEAIRHLDEAGNEFWQARELAEVLEYSQYRRFLPVIDCAREACRTSDRAAVDHFEDVLTMVDIGSGARREIEGVRLSRYALQNGDPSKSVIANGQTYFALQTRRQELVDDATLRGLIVAGFASGPAQPVTTAYWIAQRKRLHAPL